jgi:hypothetical protein
MKFGGKYLNLLHHPRDTGDFNKITDLERAENKNEHTSGKIGQ